MRLLILAKILKNLKTKLATFAFYNVENFYSNQTDFEYSFLPSNYSKWVETRYNFKVDKISFAISRIGVKETEDLPFLVGLCEVENEIVLNDLIKHENLIDGNYNYVFYESLDERKINVACIYRKDFIRIDHSEPIRVVFKNQLDERSYTRDILFLEATIGEEKVYFFIVHLPSKLDLEVNQEKRGILLRKIQQRVALIKEKESDPKIIVMGDFNDTPTAENIRLILNTKPSKQEVGINDFYNPMVGLMSYKRGSLVHHKQWMLFDQMLFSHGFLTQNSTLEIVKTDIFDESFLTVNVGKLRNFPARSFVGSKYLGGYSDHFPIYTIIKY